MGGDVDGTASADFLATVRMSSIGAVAACALCTPLDVARHSAQASFSKRRPTVGFIEALRISAKPGVLSGLWRGLPPAIGHAALSPGVFMVVYEQQKSYRSALEAAAVARGVQTILLQPFDFVRTCHQASLGAGSSPHLNRGVVDVMAKDGTRSLWRGLIPTLIRDVGGCVGFWIMYMGLRNKVCDASAEDTVSNSRRRSHTYVLPAAVLGAGCAALTTVVTQPLDVVKTRMQAHEFVHSDKAGWRKVRPARVFATLSAAHTAAGIQGLWTGGVARAAKAAVGGLLLGPLFEFCQLIAEDVTKPTRRPFQLPEDTTNRIVHPRQYQSMYIEVK